MAAGWDGFMIRAIAQPKFCAKEYLLGKRGWADIPAPTY
jgi:hypothetical protein